MKKNQGIDQMVAVVRADIPAALSEHRRSEIMRRFKPYADIFTKIVMEECRKEGYVCHIENSN